ncbi:hypothetical protein BGW37DRAFT_405712, partial [Umbelopsis sp. PMI_123]
TLQRFKRLYWFPNMRNCVAHQVRICRDCQQVKSPRRSLRFTNLVATDPALQPFDVVAIDAFSNLPTSNSGNNYLLVAYLLFSRYVIIVPIRDLYAPTIATALVSRLFSEHGFPRIL